MKHSNSISGRILAIAIILVVVHPALAQSQATDPWTIDFRYAPPGWQTSICLPDDWQKTLVGKDGALLYDYPGKFAGFGTKITAGLAAQTTWIKQELASARVPIVRTLKRADSLEVLEETFAVAPLLPPAKSSKKDAISLERVGSQGAQANWAKPPKHADPAFRNVAVGWNQPIQYRFEANPKETYLVFFGLCEGWHTNAGKRVMNLQIEGKTRQTVDPFAEHGRNAPALYSFQARDENRDGFIDLAVQSAPNSTDVNTTLNVLWIFPGSASPATQELLAGQSSRPALAHLDCGASLSGNNPPRQDLLTIELRNSGTSPANAIPTLIIESESAITPDSDHTHVRIGPGTILFSPQPFTRFEKTDNKLVLFFSETNLPPNNTHRLAFGVLRGRNASEVPTGLAQARALRQKAERFWLKYDLPYDRITVPDPGIQTLLDSSIRNIYQAREIKKDLPAFQVGPTCYRGLWVVDGSFLLEAITYLGRPEETRNGVKYLMSFQRDDGAILLMDGHWKETGIALWAITRHARLTGDKEWLRAAWPKLQRGFEFIRKMRKMAPPDAPNADLVPDGFSDGGLADRVPEYTNIYWTMAGMHAAIDAAHWLGLHDQAANWQQEYDSFYQAFRRAATRDTKTDPHGNRYVPIRMSKGQNIPPQKAQWAFLHAVFPGKVFDSSDPLVQGNMAMLKNVESQGLILDTGWLKDGIWTYFASFYGHGLLWLGDGQKAARTLYAFGNHASPLAVWREEQKPVGQGDPIVGDMPHNWASAEFIRLARHCLVLERGNELHLFEGFPTTWAKAGAVTKLDDVLTEFGPVSLEFRVSDDGSTGTLKMKAPRRNPPARIVWHVEPWSNQKGIVELPVKGSCKKIIPLR